MAIEDNFLHVNFGPTNAKSVEKSEITAFHFLGGFLKRWSCHSNTGAECALQRMPSVVMGPARFRNHAPHVDKAMDHALVNLKVYGDARHAKQVSVGNAFVNQGVTFCQANPCRRKPVMPLCQHGCKTPIISVFGVNVMVKEPINRGFVQHETCVIRVMRRRLLSCGGAWVNEQLQSQLQTCVSGLKGTYSGQSPSRTVTAPRQRFALQAQRAG
jgi:hypothetical protein